MFYSEVILGEHTLGKNPDCTKRGRGRTCAPRFFKRGIAKIKKHEFYNGTIIQNDIALIQVNESIPLFTEDSDISFVSPVCLPWNSNDTGNSLDDSDYMYVTGWGRVTNNRLKSSLNYKRFRASTPTLRKARLPYVSDEKCKQENIFKNLDTTKQICAGAVDGKAFEEGTL